MDIAKRCMPWSIWQINIARDLAIGLKKATLSSSAGLGSESKTLEAIKAELIINKGRTSMIQP